jgi:hypothetical protein
MIRPYTPSDHDYIAKSWFETFRGSSLARSLSPEIYRRRFSPLIDHLLEKSTVTIIADDESNNVILGWICHDGALLHYLHVRDAFHRQGHATALLAAIDKVKVYTFRTLDWQKFGQDLCPDAVYDPAWAWRYLTT